MQAADIHKTISAALTAGRLFSGGLLRTEEPSATWLFTSTLPAQTVSLFSSHADEAVVTSDVIGMGPEWVCWVVGYQVQRVQHRWFLPLLGAQVEKLVRNVKRTGLGLWMDPGGDETVLHARLPVSGSLVSGLRQRWRSCVAGSAAEELLLQTAAQLLAPRSLMPGQGTPHPDDVSVTAVIPMDLPRGLPLARYRNF